MSYFSKAALPLVVVLSFAVVLLSQPVAAIEESVPAAQPMLADRMPSFQEVIEATASQLASLSGSDSSMTLFKTVIGPRVGLNDAALAVGAKGLSPAMTKDLFMADLTRSAGELVRGLAAWQSAEVVRSLNATSSSALVEGVRQQIQRQMAWISEGTGLEPFLRRILILSENLRSSGNSFDPPLESLPGTDVTTEVAEAAASVQTWAIQTVQREWVRLFTWKDQVRQQRGLARLCGTWQWSVHNHQNHREEKTAVIFSPPGAPSAISPTEISVIGDTVYLRWETRAGVQEDSLLFSGEGHRLEGTFVNTAGGWGSITGKRTASCSLKTGESPAGIQRRRH